MVWAITFVAALFRIEWAQAKHGDLICITSTCRKKAICIVTFPCCDIQLLGTKPHVSHTKALRAAYILQHCKHMLFSYILGLSRNARGCEQYISQPYPLLTYCLHIYTAETPRFPTVYTCLGASPHANNTQALREPHTVPKQCQMMLLLMILQNHKAATFN